MTDFSVGLSEHIAYIGGALAGSIVVRDAIASYNYAKLNQNYCSPYRYDCWCLIRGR